MRRSGTETESQDQVRKPPLVAIVDDDASIRKSTSRLIRSFGFRAEAFACGQKFLTSPLAEGASCLVLDVRMPEMDGLEVQRRLAEAGLNIPIIFLSGRASDDEERRARSSGAVEFLRKPVDTATFLRVLRSVLQPS
jgi:FixJ family two-component response regulator